MKRLSIGVRLTLWYVAILALGQAVFATAMWVSLRHHLYAIVDDNLEDQADDLNRFLLAQKKDASVAKLQEEMTEEYTDEHSGEYLELYDESGTLIYRSQALEDSDLSTKLPPPREKRMFSDLVLHRKPMRFLSYRVPVRERVFAVRLGVPTHLARETLGAFRRYSLMLVPVFLLIAAGGGYWLSRRALSPVDQLTRTARTISGNSLSRRLEQLHTGDELQRLSDTLNEMLGRIEVAFRRITEFTADASHELRTPVSLIRTEAEVALRRSRDAEEYRTALEHILAEAERTTHLLEQLLAVARADSGREFLELRELDLRPVLSQAAEAWGSVIRAKNLQFTAELGNGSVWVNADPDGLRRVVDILLDNAVKYAKQQGAIRMTLLSADEQATIQVRDDGIGVPKDEQEKIFDRFYRVDKARSRSLGGAGLGLAIAQWIVQQHRGSILVQSELGKGSLFEVHLPLQAKPALK